MVAIHYGFFHIIALSENSTKPLATPFYLTDKINKEMACTNPGFEFLKEFKNPCFIEELKKKGRAVYENNTMIGFLSKHYSERLMNNMYPAVLDERKHGGLDNGVDFTRKRLRCLPYYYVLGVAKSGTSDLYKRMHCHPHIVGGMRKASEWLGTYRFQKDISLSDYIDFNDPAARQMVRKLENMTGDSVAMITGDHSTWTLTRQHQYEKGKVFVLISSSIIIPFIYTQLKG